MQERRSSERFELTPSPAARIGERGECQLLNLSECGALIRHEFELPGERHFYLDVEIPSASILLQSRVIWTRHTDHGFLTGLSFQPAGEALREIIESLIDSEQATKMRIEQTA